MKCKSKIIGIYDLINALNYSKILVFYMFCLFWQVFMISKIEKLASSKASIQILEFILIKIHYQNSGLVQVCKCFEDTYVGVQT